MCALFAQRRVGAGQPQHEADHLGHGAVELARDLLIELYAGERLRQQCVALHCHAMGLGLFDDRVCNGAPALRGDARGGVLAMFIFQRDSSAAWVGLFFLVHWTSCTCPMLTASSWRSDA